MVNCGTWAASRRSVSLRASRCRRDAGKRRASSGGFSLLEVILSTAILSAAAMVLYSTFSLGDRQGREAAQLMEAQLLCQSTLDELLAEPTRIENVESTPFEAYPRWAYAISWTPTELENVILLTVRVTPNTMALSGPAGSAAGQVTPSGLTSSGAGFATGEGNAASSGDNATTASTRSGTATGGVPMDPRSCTLVRWLHVPGKTRDSDLTNAPSDRNVTPLGSRAALEGTGSSGFGAESAPGDSSGVRGDRARRSSNSLNGATP